MSYPRAKPWTLRVHAAELRGIKPFGIYARREMKNINFSFRSLRLIIIRIKTALCCWDFTFHPFVLLWFDVKNIIKKGK